MRRASVLFTFLIVLSVGCAEIPELLRPEIEAPLNRRSSLSETAITSRYDCLGPTLRHLI